MGPPPKPPGTRARRNASPPTTKLSAAGRGKRRAPAWPLLDDITLSVKKRMADADAVAHLDLQHASMFEPTITAAEENAADQLAARRLISVQDLANVLAWTFDNREIASELDVSVEMVEVRATHLHPAERHYLRRRMAQREAVA